MLHSLSGYSEITIPWNIQCKQKTIFCQNRKIFYNIITFTIKCRKLIENIMLNLLYPNCYCASSESKSRNLLKVFHVCSREWNILCGKLNSAIENCMLMHTVYNIILVAILIPASYFNTQHTQSNVCAS